MTYRKHPGINQRTGQLKKGYYYTSNRCSEGLAEIKKVSYSSKTKSSSFTPFLLAFVFAIIVSPSILTDEVIENFKAVDYGLDWNSLNEHLNEHFNMN